MKPWILLACAMVPICANAEIVGERDGSISWITPLGGNSYRLDWRGEEGVTFFAQYSLDLMSWHYLPEVDHGLIHDPIDITPLDGSGTPYPKFFMLLKMNDTPTLDPKNADFDGDGLSNWEELTIYGTDPLKADTTGSGFLDGQYDTDGDGLPDQWEQAIIDNSPDPGSLTIEDIGNVR